MRDGTQELPDSARDALIELAERLRGRLSGRIEIVAHEGGVREVVYPPEVWKPKPKRPLTPTHDP